MKIDLLNKILGNNSYKTKEYSGKISDIEKSNLSSVETLRAIEFQIYVDVRG